MHPAQKRSILVMIDSIEQQCRQVKSLLYFSDQEAVLHSRAEPKEDVGYLSEAEEKRVEEAMEAQRLQGLKEHEAMIQNAWNENEKTVREM